MTHYQVPLYKDVSARWTCQVELENAVYGVYISWNTRAAGWFMELRDATGTPLLSGIRLEPGVLLINRYRVTVPGLPIGDFWVMDTENAPATATLSFANLGERFLLVYTYQETI